MVTASTAVQRCNAELTALGLNHSGQLGNGSYRDASVPVAVLLPVGVDAVSVSAGGYHSLAIGSDGNLYAWGDNVFGQLGNGNADTRTPMSVPLRAGVTVLAVSGAGYHSLATIRATTTGSAPPALRSGAHRATMPG